MVSLEKIAEKKVGRSGSLITKGERRGGLGFACIKIDVRKKEGAEKSTLSYLEGNWVIYESKTEEGGQLDISTKEKKMSKTTSNLAPAREGIN